MILSQLKAEAEEAKKDRAALDVWQECLSPDDVLRLVEVARLAMEIHYSQSFQALLDLDGALGGIEP